MEGGGESLGLRCRYDHCERRKGRRDLWEESQTVAQFWENLGLASAESQGKALYEFPIAI